MSVMEPPQRFCAAPTSSGRIQGQVRSRSGYGRAGQRRRRQPDRTGIPQRRGSAARAGASLDDIVSCLVHLSDLAQFAEFNATYANQFPGAVKPVRTTVGSDLAAGMRWK